MVAVMQICVYLLVFALLSLIALERARRCGHVLEHWSFAAFGGAGAIASLVCALESTSAYALIIVFACAAVCASTDLATGLIYNSVVNAGLIAVAALSLADPLRALAGATLGYGLAYALHALTRGRGLGFGDVKLFGLSGGALGSVGTLGCFAGAFVLGAVVSIALVARARIKRSSPIPFAPYIAAAAMVMGCIYL